VEETAAAARNLSAEVQALSEQTALFRTQAGGGIAELPAPARTTPALTQRRAAGGGEALVASGR